jgi:NADH dehydrogenase
MRATTRATGRAAERGTGTAGRRILISGGGYAGFYTAWKLEKRLRRGEAEVTVVDPRPYMTYQPFLPEVAAGSIDPRHAVVPLRRHLRRTRVVAGKVTGIDHATRTATVLTGSGAVQRLRYDVVVVTAGAVPSAPPVPGIADEAIGLKTVEEAAAVRDRLLTHLDRAAGLPPGPERDRLLTVVVIGAGYAGVEAFGELLSLAHALLPRYPELRREDLRFHLVELSDRILPEVSLPASRWVVEHLTARGAQVHLGTTVTSAVGGRVRLSTGELLESDLILWTAGVKPSPLLMDTDLPVDPRGRLRVRADLRVVDEDGAVVPDAWGAGDVAAVPDLTGGGIQGFTVPNAQHAVRQGKLLARNLVADLRGRPSRDYVHHDLGSVATLGLGTGVFQSGPISVRGFPAWVMHRGYHVLAVPGWERKWRVLVGWVLNVLLGRDLASLAASTHPRAAFEEAVRPPAPRSRPGYPARPGEDRVLQAVGDPPSAG